MSLARRMARKATAATLPAKRIAICTPSGDEVQTQYAMSLVHMVTTTLLANRDDLEAIQVLSVGTSILPHGRIQLARQALGIGATHILWIDSDMKFPADMLLRFMDHKHPLVSINAMSRRAPHYCTARKGEFEVVTGPDSTGLEEVDRIGFGVVYMDVAILHAIEEPWFDFEWVPELKCFRGEDFYFVEKAKAAGFKPVIDHDISKEVLHMGQFGFNPTLQHGGK